LTRWGGSPPRAGHRVAVLLKVYAKCIDGEDQIAKRRIEDALAESITPAAPYVNTPSRSVTEQG